MKQKSLMKRASAVLLAAALTISAFPLFPTNAYASENTLPKKENQLPPKTSFLYAEDLMTFDTNDKDGNINPAKIYFGNDDRQWWIAGSQKENSLTLLAEHRIDSMVEFEPDWNLPKTDASLWADCTYPDGSNITAVYPNHYGASSIRRKLKALEKTYFTSSEQALMDETTIYTKDMLNKTVYTTTDKLYLAYGDDNSPFNQHITVGVNSKENLNDGLRVDMDYWSNFKFWLRTPSPHSRGSGLTARRGSIVFSDILPMMEMVVPAFEFNMSSVNFASSARAASYDGMIQLHDAYTLRYKSPVDIGKATISKSKQSIAITDVPNDNTYLVVQNNEGAWSKKVSNNDLVFTSDFDNDIDSPLSSFDNCKVWLETTNDRITYAEEAVQGNGYNVKVNVGENLTVNDGNILQFNVSGDIAEIAIKANAGYYIPDDYSDNIKGLNGLKLTGMNKHGFAIAGTPTNDVNVTLPSATALKDGNSLIVVPNALTTTYREGLKLSDLDLPKDSGWSWKNPDTPLYAGTNSHPATFDTTDFESTTDFSAVEGYDKDTHKVTRNVEVIVNKADSKLSITTSSLDKEYDGKTVSNPEYKASGSDGKVTITWQKNIGSADTPKWEDLKAAPIAVGNYRVALALAGNDNYNSANSALDFVISKTTNAWTDELSIEGWTYNEKANAPVAKAKFGDVTFTYSSAKNGPYTNEVPKNAGTYYVKATVEGTEDYTGLESIVSFKIAKAIPTYEEVTGLVLKQGHALSEIELPADFKWVDDTITADELGTHKFKAIYTPKDTANYQTIEVDIEVKVVPTPVAINNVPTINATDKTITATDEFDPLKDVTANDNEDGDLTSKIKVINNTVDTNKAGTYEVIYQVTDSQGATVTKTIKVTVNALPTNPDTEKPDTDKPNTDKPDTNKPDGNKPNTDKPNNDKNDGSVQTGDSNDLLLWEMLLTGSSIALLYTLYRKKRKAQ